MLVVLSVTYKKVKYGKRSSFNRQRLIALLQQEKALNTINMTFYKNEITALIGPSGCGKSTLLRSINRMNDLIPTVTITGAIDYKGKNIYSPKVDTVDLRKEIGMVFPTTQSFSIFNL